MAKTASASSPRFSRVMSLVSGFCLCGTYACGSIVVHVQRIHVLGHGFVLLALGRPNEGDADGVEDEQRYQPDDHVINRYCARNRANEEDSAASPIEATSGLQVFIRVGDHPSCIRIALEDLSGVPRKVASLT